MISGTAAAQTSWVLTAHSHFSKRCLVLLQHLQRDESNLAVRLRICKLMQAALQQSQA